MYSPEAVTLLTLLTAVSATAGGPGQLLPPLLPPVLRVGALIPAGGPYEAVIQYAVSESSMSVLGARHSPGKHLELVWRTLPTDMGPNVTQWQDLIYQQGCHLFLYGISGMFTIIPSSAPSHSRDALRAAVRNLSADSHVPLINVDQSELPSQSRDQGHRPISINLYPSVRVRLRAYQELLTYLTDRSRITVALIHQPENTLTADVAAKGNGQATFTYSLHRLISSDVDHISQILSDIRSAGHKHILLDTSLQLVTPILIQAQRLHMISPYYHWHVFNMDLDTLASISSYIGDDIRSSLLITSFRLVDITSPHAVDVISYWQELEHMSGIIQNNYIASEVGALYDAVLLYATAVKDLLSSEAPSLPPINMCGGHSTSGKWKHGRQLGTLLKQTHASGLTGWLQVDSRGDRHNVTLQLTVLGLATSRQHSDSGMHRVGRWSSIRGLSLDDGGGGFMEQILAWKLQQRQWRPPQPATRMSSSPSPAATTTDAEVTTTLDTTTQILSQTSERTSTATITTWKHRTAGTTGHMTPTSRGSTPRSEEIKFMETEGVTFASVTQSAVAVAGSGKSVDWLPQSGMIEAFTGTSETPRVKGYGDAKQVAVVVNGATAAATNYSALNTNIASITSLHLLLLTTILYHESKYIRPIALV